MQAHNRRLRTLAWLRPVIKARLAPLPMVHRRPLHQHWWTRGTNHYPQVRTVQVVQVVQGTPAHTMPLLKVHLGRCLFLNNSCLLSMDQVAKVVERQVHQHVRVSQWPRALLLAQAQAMRR